MDNDTNNYDMLTVAEISALMRLSRVSIYRMIGNKKLPCYRLNGSLRFNRDDVMQFIENNKI